MNIWKLSKYLDELLKIKEIDDISLNGLVIEGKRDVKRVGFCVDTSIEVIKMAIKEDLDLIIAHHGIYWGHPLPIKGGLHEKLKLFLESGIGLYVAHLPLDAHPLYGNNIQGVRLFSPDDIIPVLDIGFLGKFNTPRKQKEILDVAKEKINPNTILWNFGNEEIEKFIFISGDALSMLPKVIELGVNTYITGEPKHSLYTMAKEEKVNVLLTGHYMSETLGIKALSKHIEEKFFLNTVFLDFPTGY
ncbi:MAG TPA: Nif3-like dinuclear metal center hexameric protein [Candidatus Atribacteria bacterium]|nr:Nif3-like dinuclear metal center hexameric protein [Candidatus Atribacteria bacterium]